jgi:mRNA interferase MazF
MPNFSKNEVVLVRYPFSDLSNTKVRPAVIVNAPHSSQDCFVIPLTSKTISLLEGEFVLQNWEKAGLNVPSAVKRGLYTIHQGLILKSIGYLALTDGQQVEKSLIAWLGLSLQ